MLTCRPFKVTYGRHEKRTENIYFGPKPHGKGAKGCEKGVQPVNTNDVLRQEYRPTLIVVQNVGLMRS